MPEHEGGFRPNTVKIPDSAALVEMIRVTRGLELEFHGNESSDDYTLDDAEKERMKRVYAEKIGEELPSLVSTVLSGGEFQVRNAMTEISFLLGPAELSLTQLVGTEVASAVAAKTAGMDLSGFGKKYGQR